MKHTIATTSIDGFSYDDYLEVCDINGIEPKEDGSAEYYEWCQEEASDNWESDMDSISCFGPYNEPVTVRGSLGLWDGRHEIVPVEKNSVASAIEACAEGCEDVDVEWDNGVIVVKAYHHDGTNIFEIGENLPYLYD